MSSIRERTKELQVKVDTKEPRNRSAVFPNAKTWTNFDVKIEAIQCFPCYVKVTLMRNNNALDCTGQGTNQPIVVRITIPGLHIQLAASRTKNHCYGLFWKSNRKRCSIFLAFSDEQDRSSHMGWMKDSIRELERYRQDFLEIRRASRCSTEVESSHVRLTDVFSNYQNLGPLPPLPVEPLAQDWLGRQSTVSGIYEEICEPGPAIALFTKELSPTDKIKGIYERLYRRRSGTLTQSLLAQTPPPLPPRQRINTLDKEECASIPASSDTLKKKKYKSLLESIFGKQASRGELRRCVETSEEDVRDFTDPFKAETNLNKNKRNSFSTPELANWGDADDDDRMQSLKENGNDALDWHGDDVSCVSLLSESMDIPMELNISDKIKPNFNLSMNASSINLVGCNFNAIRESEVGIRDGRDSRKSLHQLNGYCVMKPIPQEQVCKPEVDERSSGYCVMGPSGFDRNQFDLSDELVRGVVNEERVKCLDMKNITMTRGSEPELGEKMTDDDKSFLRRKPKRTELDAKDEQLYENCKGNRCSRGSKYLVDEKISSYFPNDSPPSMANAIKTPPKLVPKQRSRPSVTPSPRRAVPNIYSIPRNNSPVLMDSAKDTEMLKQSLTDSISKLSLINSPSADTWSPKSPKDNAVKGDPVSLTTTPEKKSGKFDSISPGANKYMDKCSLKADFANLKRFASLPRFRKLDLSPLRIKLNNVLHRNNSEF